MGCVDALPSPSAPCVFLRVDASGLSPSARKKLAALAKVGPFHTIRYERLSIYLAPLISLTPFSPSFHAILPPSISILFFPPLSLQLHPGGVVLAECGGVASPSFPPLQLLAAVQLGLQTIPVSSPDHAATYLSQLVSYTNTHTHYLSLSIETVYRISSKNSASLIFRHPFAQMG